MMAGTAYRSIVAARTDIGPFAADAQALVFDLVPPWLNPAGWTSQVVVTAHLRGDETCIYPADGTGMAVDWQPIEVYPGVDHDAALRAIGYPPAPLTAYRADEHDSYSDCDPGEEFMR